MIDFTTFAPSWIAPTLVNSWTNFNLGLYEVKYCKDFFGWVHLRGGLKNGSSLNATMFTLPSGYRPAQKMIFSVGGHNGAAVNIHVDSNGEVAVDGSNGFTNLVLLDNIYYYAES